MLWAMRKTEERRAIRMQQMMNRLNVDALVLIRLRNGDAYAEARSRCLGCEDSSLCLVWLDRGQPDSGPDFCPNLEFFKACKMISRWPMPARRPRPRSCWRRAKARGRI